MIVYEVITASFPSNSSGNIGSLAQNFSVRTKNTPAVIPTEIKLTSTGVLTFLLPRSKAVIHARMAADMKKAPTKSMRLSFVQILCLSSMFWCGSSSLHQTSTMERSKSGHCPINALYDVSPMVVRDVALHYSPSPTDGLGKVASYQTSATSSYSGKDIDITSVCCHFMQRYQIWTESKRMLEVPT
jgi:hypothetical protein